MSSSSDESSCPIVSEETLVKIWMKSISGLPVLKYEIGIEGQEREDLLSGLVVSVKGDRCSFVNGRLHAENGPAAEYVDGSKEYFFDGKYHRIGGPAIDRADGTVGYYRNGKPYGEVPGEPTVRDRKGYQAWYKGDKKHREDGPAIVMPDGKTEWFLDGEPWPNGSVEASRRKKAAEIAAHEKMIEGIETEILQGLPEKMTPNRPLRLKRQSRFIGFAAG